MQAVVIGRESEIVTVELVKDMFGNPKYKVTFKDGSFSSFNEKLFVKKFRLI